MAIILFLLTLIFASPVSAGWHLYISDTIGGGTSTHDFEDAAALAGITNRRANRIYFGKQGVVFVAADVTDAQDAAIAALPGVIKIPDNLDQQVGAQLTVVQNLLESKNIPAGWVTAATTYRTVVKAVIGIFAFANRYAQVAQSAVQFIDNKNVTLNTTFGSLPAPARQKLADTAANLKLDTSGVTGSTTIRQLLKSVSDQWIANRGGLQIGGITIASVPIFDRLYEWLRGVLQPAVAWAITQTDLFNRPNAQLTISPWSDDGKNPLQIVSQRVRAVGNGEGYARFIGFSPADDQEASIGISTMITNGFVGSHVRWSAASHSGYVGGCTLNGSVIWIADPDFRIISDTNAIGCGPGDVLKLQVVGDQLTLFVNSTTRLDAPDVGGISSGDCGISVEYFVDVNEVEADNFDCTDGTTPPAGAGRRKQGVVYQ